MSVMTSCTPGIALGPSPHGRTRSWSVLPARTGSPGIDTGEHEGSETSGAVTGVVSLCVGDAVCRGDRVSALASGCIRSQYTVCLSKRISDAKLLHNL